MDAFLPECQYLPETTFAAWMKQWRRTLAIPADALTVLREILKFLGTLTLIIATALILLMAG